jgi:hypothetical protein
MMIIFGEKHQFAAVPETVYDNLPSERKREHHSIEAAAADASFKFN